jgi:hypothetical protein
MDTSKIFGQPNSFAIQYRPNNNKLTIDSADNFAFCHLIIDKRTIGYSTETCYLPTWVCFLTDKRNFIEKNRNDLFPKEFEKLSDREIFESILKANQLEEEFHADFLYLPQLTTDIWYRHSFQLDETIDAFLFYYYIKANQIKFLIEDRSKKEDRNKRSNDFIFASADIDNFFKTVDETITFLVNTYPHLTDNVSKGDT